MCCEYGSRSVIMSTFVLRFLASGHQMKRLNCMPMSGQDFAQREWNGEYFWNVHWKTHLNLRQALGTWTQKAQKMSTTKHWRLKLKFTLCIWIMFHYWPGDWDRQGEKDSCCVVGFRKMFNKNGARTWDLLLASQNAVLTELPIRSVGSIVTWSCDKCTSDKPLVRKSVYESISLSICTCRLDASAKKN